ncbi:MAG: methyltransferase domain-containing protein [Gammaproteobacteria bacterium]|nr:methyltransferase domain-containing protein [Gammaproteobacteria bacterium]
MTNLKAISSRTVGHYEARADAYWAGTHDHDVRQNINALLDAIEGTPPHTILDFGCGPGRDLKTFSELGHVAIGLDGSTRFTEMARAHSGCEVWTQDFLDLELPREHFDGVFANAVLFHIPTAALPRVLRQLHASLKVGGVLFSSNPRGQNQEGWNGERYGAYHALDVWRRYLIAAQFTEITHYYRPAGAPPAQQHWLASVWRRAT